MKLSTLMRKCKCNADLVARIFYLRFFGDYCKAGGVTLVVVDILRQDFKPQKLSVPLCGNRRTGFILLLFHRLSAQCRAVIFFAMDISKAM